MPEVPDEVTRMAPRLREEVERQLLADLGKYGVVSEDLWIDWSTACQEGHLTTCLGGDLEDLSGLVVRHATGVAVADGWMDFVHGGGDNPLFVFWLFLAVGSGEDRRKVKDKAGIPLHVWRELPDTTKALCASDGGYDSRWSKDPRVIAWRTSHAR